MKKIFFILQSEGTFSADSYIPLGYLLSENYRVIYYTFSFDVYSEIKENKLLFEAIEESGKLIGPLKKYKTHKILAYCKLLLEGLTSLRSIIFYYWPYNRCSKLVTIWFYIVKTLRGRGYILSKRSSIIFEKSEDIRKRECKINSNKILCNTLFNFKNHDGNFCFIPEEQFAKKDLDRYRPIPSLKAIPIGIPHLDRRWVGFYNRVAHKYIDNNKYFLLVLAKSVTSFHLRSNKDYLLSVHSILSFLRKGYPDFKVVIKLHPREVLDIKLLLGEYYKCNLVEISEQSSMLLSILAKTIFILGPTAVAVQLFGTKRIDITHYSDEYKLEKNQSIYYKYGVVQCFPEDADIMKRYIDDDNYFKSNCNTQGEDKIKSESIENAKYIQNILL